MTAPFFIINVFALSSLSKFTDYSAVRIAHHIPTPQHIEDQILLNSYTAGSRRNKSNYEDVVLNGPSQQQALRLVCNFMDRFKSRPLFRRLSTTTKQFFDLFILHGTDSKPVDDQFILARPSISTIKNYSLSTSKHLALINISIHTLSAPKPLELMHFL